MFGAIGEGWIRFRLSCRRGKGEEHAALNSCVIRDYNRTSGSLSPKPCGMDSLYLYLGPAGFSSRFERSRRARSDYGKERQDFRDIGIPIIVHRPENPKWRKLQFVNVGAMDQSAILGALREVTDFSPTDLRIFRVDLTADLIGAAPMDRFRESMTVRLKRNPTQYCNPNADLYEAQRREYGKWETLYFGSSRSNDYFRVYDKAAQLKKVSRNSSKHPEEWVRFERSLLKSAIPKELRTLGDLLAHGAEYDPFAPIEISPAFDASVEHIYEWEGPLRHRLVAAWALTITRLHGRTEAARLIRRSGRDPRKVFAILDTVLADVTVPMPSGKDITAIYQRNFRRQLFGSRASLDAVFEAGGGTITIGDCGSESR